MRTFLSHSEIERLSAALGDLDIYINNFVRKLSSDALKEKVRSLILQKKFFPDPIIQVESNDYLDAFNPYSLTYLDTNDNLEISLEDKDLYIWNSYGTEDVGRIHFRKSKLKSSKLKSDDHVFVSMDDLVRNLKFVKKVHCSINTRNKNVHLDDLLTAFRLGYIDLRSVLPPDTFIVLRDLSKRSSSHYHSVVIPETNVSGSGRTLHNPGIRRIQSSHFSPSRKFVGWIILTSYLTRDGIEHNSLKKDAETVAEAMYQVYGEDATLGLLGFAEMLLIAKIPYGYTTSIQFADTIISALGQHLPVDLTLDETVITKSFHLTPNFDSVRSLVINGEPHRILMSQLKMHPPIPGLDDEKGRWSKEKIANLILKNNGSILNQSWYPEEMSLYFWTRRDLLHHEYLRFLTSISRPGLKISATHAIRDNDTEEKTEEIVQSYYKLGISKIYVA